MLSAKLAKSGGGVTHHLRLLLSHGSMPDSVYEVRSRLLHHAGLRSTGQVLCARSQLLLPQGTVL